MREAIGLIETIGLIGAVEALDVALKSADVSFVKIDYVGSGIVTVTISGDVASVKAGVESSVAATKRLDCYRASHVIPRLMKEVYTTLYSNDEVSEDEKTINIVNVETVKEEVIEPATTKEETTEETTSVETEDENEDRNFHELKVSELREYITKNIGGYSKNELRKLNKDKLVDVILNHKN